MARNNELEFAVIGLGRFGVNVAQRFKEMGHSVLGIENDPQVAKEMENRSTEVFVLDATNPDALAEAGITSFKTVVVAINDDFETNALVTSTLKNLGIPNIICLAGSTRHQEILSANWRQPGGDPGQGERHPTGGRTQHARHAQ